MPQRISIAHHTRARLAPPQLSSLVELVENHVPTAKITRPETPNSNHFAGLCESLGLSTLEVSEFAGLCEKLTILDDGDALALLDRESGKLLETCQLRKDPCFKTVWDRSYANELRWLCQGISTGDKAGGKRVAGTNTCHLITFADIPHHKKKKKISTQRWCVRYMKGRRMKIAQGSQSGEPNLLSRRCRHQYSIIGTHKTHVKQCNL